MDEQLTISTPEQVAFHYEMAGIGTRFVAGMLDHLIIFTALLLIGCAMQTIVIGSIFSSAGDAVVALVLALMLLIYFAIFWGYFVLFETLWNGQTPGKRAGRLRVIRRDGQPVHAGEVMIRNLVRLVDMLPGFYGVGLVVMFIDKDARRLGDMAAGTIVVREGDLIRLQDVRVTPATASSTFPPANQPAYGSAGYGAFGYGAASPFAPTSYSGGYAPAAPAAPRYDPLPGVSLRDLSPADYLLIRELLARWSRGELNQERASNLARTLAEGVASRMGHDFREWQDRGWEPIAFLQSLLIAKDARD
jgi:uncharacterized RDD family membrane protein YckC